MNKQNQPISENLFDALNTEIDNARKQFVTSQGIQEIISATNKSFLELEKAFNGLVSSIIYPVLKAIGSVMRMAYRIDKEDRKRRRHWNITHGKHTRKRPRGRRKV
jgi:hypothetical protein